MSKKKANYKAWADVHLVICGKKLDLDVKPVFYVNGEIKPINDQTIAAMEQIDSNKN